MDKAKTKPAYIWLTLVLVPAFVCTLNYVLFGDAYFYTLRLFIFATISTFALSFTTSQLHIFIAEKMRKQFPSINQVYKRIIVWNIVMLPLTPLLILLLFFFYRAVNIAGHQPEFETLKWALLTGFVADIIGTAFNEGIYTFSKWKENIMESEQLKKANLQTQFEGLKNQVNPHFLFNSINTLSSLIHEDKERAEKFIDEMSNVYRYLLRNNEEELVTLSTELKFIASYYHLLKTRYGKGIEMKLSIDRNSENYLLPPLTLQLLVENAVKHNNVLKEKPLIIEISTDNNGWLTVNNNLQKKTIKVNSAQIGLNNIKEKFRLLNQPEVMVKETFNEFIVKLQLIEKMTEVV